ncbi:MAG TPA: VOC family protein [Solirubrobacterales bacterium]|nr:VOC family protein [Solirubrobacterales bacterium]
MSVTLDELTVADDAAAWEACGFRVENGTCVVGGVRLRFCAPGGEGGGLAGWSLRGVGPGRDGEVVSLDGLPTTRAEGPPAGPAPTHPNGVEALDHVVAVSPDLDRTVAALRAAGLDLRRIREEPTPAGAPRQAFFRLGAPLLEVVQEPAEATARHGGDRPAFFWGLAFLVDDVDAAAAALGERAGEPRAAVQPGRRIVTLRRSAGLSLPVALMSRPESSSIRSG